MFTLVMIHVFILKLLLICVHVLNACVFIQHIINTSTIADARHQEENSMRKKCLNAIVQEGHNICTSEWEMPSAILKANTV